MENKTPKFKKFDYCIYIKSQSNFLSRLLQIFVVPITWIFFGYIKIK